MNRYRRPAPLAVVAAILLLLLPSGAALAARPSDGLKASGDASATVGELATLTLTLPASVAAFDGRVFAAPGAAEVIGVAPVGGGTGLRPEASGDGTAIGAYNLAAVDGATTVLVAVNPLVAGRIQVRVLIDSAADTDGNRLILHQTAAVATISAGDGTRLVAAPNSGSLLAPPSNAVKPKDLRPDGRFNVQDLDAARAAWSRAHSEVGAICGGAPDGDANGDGCTDSVDLQLLRAVRGEKVSVNTSSTPLATEPDLSSTRAVLSTTPDVTSVGDFVPLRTFTVTSTGDTADAAPGDGICADSNGDCTLRAALTEADYMQGEDRIAFNLPGTAPVTIHVGSRLPLITSRSGGVFIDGYSQPGASPNTAQVGSNAVPGVYLRGNGNAAREYGLYITSGGNIVSGLAIGNFWRALMLDGTDATGNLIVGNWLGFTGTGSNNGGSIGILMDTGSHDNTVGTPALADRNVIGNFPVGVDVYGPGTDGTTFQNNQFCISPSGARATCNVGIDHNFGPKRNLIGGSGANEKNVFGPTNYQGIELSHGYNTSVPPDTDFSLPYQINDHQIIGNWVGFRMDGTYDPAYRSGLNFSSADNAEGINVYDGVFNNLVEDNYVASVYDGIILRSPHASDNILRGNVIGVAPNGGGAAPLTGWGIKIGWSATHNLVEDNVIRNAAAGGIGLVNTTNTGLPQAPAYNIKLSRNLVSDTNGPAIDLFGIAGPDPNDPGDADLGANGLLNTPIITGVTTTTVTGTGEAGATVEVYTVDRAIGAYGLPQAYLGSAVVAGNGTWTLATTLTGSDVVSAIQIAPDWNTSEFSPNAGYEAPSITSASSTTFPAGHPSSFTVTTTGNPAPAISRPGRAAARRHVHRQRRRHGHPCRHPRDRQRGRLSADDHRGQRPQPGRGPVVHPDGQRCSEHRPGRGCRCLQHVPGTTLTVAAPPRTSRSPDRPWPRPCGTVSAGGTGLPGATVHVFDAATYTWVGYTVTTTGGAYTIDLPSGTYKLFVQPDEPGYPDQWVGGSDHATADVVDLTGGSTTKDVTLAGPPVATTRRAPSARVAPACRVPPSTCSTRPPTPGSATP